MNSGAMLEQDKQIDQDISTSNTVATVINVVIFIQIDLTSSCTMNINFRFSFGYRYHYIVKIIPST